MPRPTHTRYAFDFMETSASERHAKISLVRWLARFNPETAGSGWSLDMKSLLNILETKPGAITLRYEPYNWRAHRGFSKFT